MKRCEYCGKPTLSRYLEYIDVADYNEETGEYFNYRKAPVCKECNNLAESTLDDYDEFGEESPQFEFNDPQDFS